MRTPLKSIPIAAARLIVRGDIDSAAKILLDDASISLRALDVCEARAIAGACRYARQAYPGCHVTLRGLVWA
jgi:hypothetical protein